MKKVSGIRSRWLRHNASFMVLLVIVVALAAALGIAGYYHMVMRSGLETHLKTTTDFFETYVSDSQEGFYNSIYSLTQDFEEKNSLELEFVNTQREIVTSSFGLASGTRAATADVEEALTEKRISTFRGRDPQTGEKIMAVSGPIYDSSGQLAGVLRIVTSMETANRQIFFWVEVSCCLRSL